MKIAGELYSVKQQEIAQGVSDKRERKGAADLGDCQHLWSCMPSLRDGLPLQLVQLTALDLALDLSEAASKSLKEMLTGKQSCAFHLRCCHYQAVNPHRVTLIASPQCAASQQTGQEQVHRTVVLGLSFQQYCIS